MKKVVYLVLVLLIAVSSSFADETDRSFEICVSEAGENANVTCGFTVGSNSSSDDVGDYIFKIYRSEVYSNGTVGDWQLYYEETNPESGDVVFTTDTFSNLVPNGLWINGTKTFSWKGTCQIEQENGTLDYYDTSQYLDITRTNSSSTAETTSE